MEQPKSYCEYVSQYNETNIHRLYHDTEYGFPIKNDNDLFGRLILEINQAGLSWNTILIKKENFRTAYHNFNIAAVAKFKEKDIELLLNNTGIIRNKLKVNAAIYNAQQILVIQNEFGSFKNWLEHHFPKTKENWIKLFKKTFKFTGEEITNEFLLSTGYLKGAHSPECPIYHTVLEKKPMWSLELNKK